MIDQQRLTQEDVQAKAVEIADLAVVWLESRLRELDIEVVDYLNLIVDYQKMRDAIGIPTTVMGA